MLGPAFWRGVAARATRSSLDALAPTLILLVCTGALQQVSGWSLAAVAVSSALLHAFKSVLTLDVEPGAATYTKAADRAAPAAVIILVGYLAAVNAGWMRIDDRGLVVAMATAFATAIAHYYLDPPRDPHDNARSGPNEPPPPG